MYENFTDRLCRALQAANRIACRRNHAYIGTGHLVLGLIDVGTNLTTFNKHASEVLAWVDKTIQRGPSVVTMRKLPQTPRARMAIKYAIEEAREYVGTGHLVLGLLRVTKGVAARAMMNSGITYRKVKDEFTQPQGSITPDEYQRLAERTSATGTRGGIETAKQQLMDNRLIRLLHGAMGLCTESGELMDQLKRHIFYGAELDITNVKEENGDLLWYIAEVLNALNVSMSDVMQTNIDKLRTRYPDKFDGDKAVNRDTDAERKVLEATEPVVGAGDDLRCESDTHCEKQVCPGCGVEVQTMQVCPDCAAKGKARFNG